MLLENNCKEKILTERILNQNLTGLSQNLLSQNLDREGLQALQYVDRVLQKLMPGFFFEDFTFSKDLYF